LALDRNESGTHIQWVSHSTCPAAANLADAGIADDLPASSCYHPLFGSRIKEYQQVGPDIFRHLQARAGWQPAGAARKTMPMGAVHCMLRFVQGSRRPRST
jgi:hypothetical protein